MVSFPSDPVWDEEEDDDQGDDEGYEPSVCLFRSLSVPERILKRCETTSCTADGSLHCWAKFCKAWPASSISWLLLDFSWPETQQQQQQQIERYFKKRNTSEGLAHN